MISKTLRDQLQDDKGTACLERRLLRPITDALASSFNIPVALVCLPPAAPKAPLKWLAKRYQNPFVALCREVSTFLEDEATHLRNAVNMLRTRDDSTILLDGGAAVLKGRFRAALARTHLPGLFLYVGPVAILTDSGMPEGADSKEDICKEIIDRLRQAYGNAGPSGAGNRAQNMTSAHTNRLTKGITLSRAERLFTQRAPITEADLCQRTKRLGRTLDAVLDAAIQVEPLSADALQALTKSVAALADRAAPETPRRELLMPTTHTARFFRTPGHEVVAEIGPNAIAISSQPKGSLDAPPMSSGRRLAWSRFCDNFRTCRNANFLELLLVTRLWAQDTYSGTTIEAEDAQERQADFDEFANRIADIFGADACVIYRFHPGELPKGQGSGRLGYLQALSSAKGYKDLDSDFEMEARHMETIAEDPIKRQQSACYRCIDSGASVFIEDAHAEEVSVAETAYPRSILVAPLISRGRIWGAIEVLGKLPAQLASDAPRWLEELVRVAAPIFYNQWMLYHFREMSRIAVSEGPTEEKYQGVIDRVRKLFLASSARLYIQNSSRTSEFECRAHAGVPFPDTSPCGFSLHNRDSVSAICIRNGIPWITGRVGIDDFTEVDHADGTGPLEDAGHKAAAVFPIRDTHGNCFASVLITSLDDEQFPEDWLAIVQTISLQLSVILEAIHLQDLEVVEQQAYFAHTIKTRTDRVAEGGERLLRMLRPLFGEAEVYERLPDLLARAESAMMSEATASQRRDMADLWKALHAAFPRELDRRDRLRASVPRAISDLGEHLSELRKSAVSLAGGPNAELPEEANPADWGGTPCPLRFALLESIKPLSDRPIYRGRMMMPDIHVLGRSVAVRIPDQVFVEMLNNLFDNAMKYDFVPPSVSISVRFAPEGRHCLLEIKNLAPRVTEEEAERLREGGVRGAYAPARDRTGTGLGLKYTMDMARRWGMGLSYDVPVYAQEGEAGQQFGWHVLRLDMEIVGGNR